ncbi:MAG: HD-GYP domain-containing protein [Hydrogenophaga sp.]|nr:HD-GYP domain-containing protein [Hydrogenophaga sp.]
MLKQIRPDQLRLGMYIQGFEGSWMDHPFWRNRFVLEEPKDLARVLASGVTGVWIDITLGDDVATGAAQAQPDKAPPAAPVLAEPEPEHESPQATPQTPCNLRDEMARAASICLSARDEMTRMFAEVRMGRAVDTGVVRELVQDITESVMRNGSAIISLARLKTADNYTYMHSVAVCALMVSLGRQLKLSDSQISDAGFAGLVHDIGKALVPMEVLNKPGRLTDEEFEQVKSHPRQGWQLLKDSGVSNAVALDVCLHHHERMDGAGYPDQLAGDQISLMARMGAVCDVYDAITSNRPYKAGWDPAESLSRMAKWTGGHFDPRVFQAFVRSLGIYPVGSLVKLNNEKLAVVVDQSPRSLLKPIVKVFYSLRHQERLPPQEVDLSAPNTKLQILGREDPADWPFPDLNDIWSGGAALPA